MNVVIVSPAYPPSPSGEAEHCYQIASRLAALGHGVTVLTTRAETARGPLGFKLDSTLKGWRWRDLPAVAAAFRRHGPQAVLLIHTTWMFGGHPMVTFLPTLARRLLPGCRFVTLFEIYSPPSVAPLGVRLLRKAVAWMSGTSGLDYHFGSLLRDSTGLIALGPTMVQAYARHDTSMQQRMAVVPPPPLLMTLPAVDAGQRQKVRAGMGLGDDDLLLAYFGFVYPGKGIDVLFQALQQLRSRGRPVWLIMAGGGRGTEEADRKHGANEAAARELAATLGVSEFILWPEGYVDADDHVARQLGAADLAVLPFDDGAELRRSSIAVVVAAGLPLITTSPQSRETVFVHGDNAWLCSPRDPVALTTAISTVADDSSLRRRLAVGARRMSQEWFSWDKAIARISSMLAEPVGAA